MMAVDKLVDSTQLDADLTSVADAIRAKSGGSADLAFPAGFVSEIGNIPTGGGGNFTLIGTKVFENVAEYTNTSTWEDMDTQISINGTDYAFGYVVITCDSAIDSTSTWGMTIQAFGRRTTGRITTAGTLQQRGTATLSKVAQTNDAINSTAYGVIVKNNADNIILQRKAYSSTITKIRAGNYTVKVYGMTAF